MKVNTNKYKKIISKLGVGYFQSSGIASDELRIYPQNTVEDEFGISVYYAPFDDVNQDAKIVLVGITPGLAQMLRACEAGAVAIANDEDWSGALSAMKRQSSFKDDNNQMRPNLFRQFNHWGVPEWFGIHDASELFSDAWKYVHTTSIVRYPTFKFGKNYVGQSPKILKHPYLQVLVDTLLVDELNQMPNALVFTFGPKVDEVIQKLASTGKIQNPVVSGMLHPSGNNTYRLNYLCGDRSGEAPYMTNVDSYDNGRSAFRRKFLGEA